jgi:hypothetical protein
MSAKGWFIFIPKLQATTMVMMAVLIQTLRYPLYAFQDRVDFVEKRRRRLGKA